MSPRIQKLRETIRSQNNSKFVTHFFETSKHSPREPSFLLTHGNTELGSFVQDATFLNTETDEPTSGTEGKSFRINNLDLRMIKSFNPTSDKDRNTT